MKTYKIYSHPNKPIPIVVKVGYSWSALLLGPIWFLPNQMWLTFGVTLSFVVSSHLYFRSFDPYTPTEAIYGLLILVAFIVGCILIGWFTNSLLCMNLVSEGYSLIDTISAENIRDARDKATKIKNAIA